MKDSSYAIFTDAKELIKQKKYNEAYDILMKLQKKEPNDIIIKFEIGKLLVKKEKFDEAKECFESLLNTRNKTYAMLELGRLEAQLSNYNEAIEYFSNLLDTKAKYHAMLELGKVYIHLGDYDKAKEYFKSILEIKNDLYAINELFFLCMKNEQYDKALEYLKQLSEDGFIKHDQLKKYLFYIKAKMNKIDKKTRVKGYLDNQIVNFNRKEAINHIKRHLDENNKKVKHAMFFNKINISKLYKTIEKDLNDLMPHTFNICDKYIYDAGIDIGIIDDKKTSFLKVVTVCNTNNIITMYPIAPVLYYKNNENNKIRKRD